MFTPDTKDPLFARQIELELEMASRGISQAQAKVAKAKEQHRESRTDYGTYLMSRAVQPVADAIKEFMDQSASGKAGRRHVAVKYLRQVSPEVAAFIALRCCLNYLCGSPPLQNVALDVAGEIENEVRLADFAAKDRAAYKRAERHTKDSNHAGYRLAVFRYIATDSGVTWETWPKTDKIHLGVKLIELVVEVTGYFSINSESGGRGKHARYFIRGTEKCLDWIDRRSAHTELMSPEYFPCIIPPKPWTGPYGGGYYSVARPLKLVKTGKANYMEELSMRVDEMPLLYEGLNAIQNTAYRINRTILEVMETLWDSGGDVAGIPPRENYSVPRCPLCGEALENRTGKYVKASGEHTCFTQEENKDSHRQWKREAARIYDKNVSTMSRRFQFAKCMWIGGKFAKEAAIWFPHQLDFRGRAYAVPSFLNPQGPDFARALLEFADGKVVDTPEALQWLAIHGANCFGNDKVSLDARFRWILDNEAAILAVAEDPFEHHWWFTADKPWQFLAFCLEWLHYKDCQRTGEPFISHLPVSMDGTCNGLQIFSLILRDEDGGRATNLLPSEKPEDIYAIVADKVTTKLQEKAVTGEDIFRKEDKESAEQVLWYNERTLAAALLGMGINRKSTKRQVMVLPYGGTYSSCCDYTLEHLRERMESGETVGLTDGNIFAASRFLAHLIWDSIGETVTSAKHAMDFLQSLATLAASEELPVNWTTPIGFIVDQTYLDMQERRIKTHLGGSIIKLNLREETIPVPRRGRQRNQGAAVSTSPKIDKRRQRNGISPNFVHSLDASAMFLSVSLARKRGVSSFMMIHDSYGTHAADAPTLARTLREAFVKLFGGQADVLARLREQVAAMLPPEKREKLPPLPERGTLDVNKVLQSVYFFA